MKTTEANIEIKRNGDGKLISVSAIMPTWSKMEDDGNLTVNIPLFGIRTFAKNSADSDVATKEAITCFCIASEKFGHGLEQELIVMGWEIIEDSLDRVTLNYSVESRDFVMEQIMQTGEQFAFEETNLAIA